MSPNPLDIVIPMAGLGSRFRDAGYTVQKPLIKILGKPMYSWAVDSLPLQAASRLIFILLGSNPDVNKLMDDIRIRYSEFDTTIVTIPELTAGQAMTVLSVRHLINGERSLLIHNADTGFQINPGWIEDTQNCGADGALLVFRSNETRWSYSREGATGRVVEVREKEVISEWASTGTYWFRRGADFVELAETRFDSATREAGEFYVGPLYNDLIARGGVVKNFVVSKLLCFGTPEDMELTLNGLGQLKSASESEYH